MLGQTNKGRISGMFKKSIMATIIATFAATAALAQTDAREPERDANGMVSPKPIDLAKLTCWDVVTLASDDRAAAMALLYGYAQGSQKNSIVAPQDIQITIVNTMMECVDTPDDKVLAKIQSAIGPVATKE